MATRKLNIERIVADASSLPERLRRDFEEAPDANREHAAALSKESL